MNESKLAARYSRRNFLRLSAGAAASSLFPAVLPSSLLGKEAPSERISIGCIGVGNHGVRRNLTRLLQEKDARVVAVCDVFDDRRDKARVMVEGEDESQVGEYANEIAQSVRRALGGA